MPDARWAGRRSGSILRPLILFLLLRKACAEVYFLRSNNADIDNLLFYNQMSPHRARVPTQKKIKRGLSYGGDKLEAAYSLENMSVDHGNFLELVAILSKYDIIDIM
jgi:hypothetical protein